MCGEPCSNCRSSQRARTSTGKAEAGVDDYGQGRGGGGRTRRKNRRRACLHVVGVVEVVEVGLQAGDGRRLSALNIAETNGRGAGTDGAGGTQRTAYESGSDGAGAHVGGGARGAGRGGALGMDMPAVEGKEGKSW